MIVRVARFNTAPPDDRHWVLESLKGVPGVMSCYHLRDPQSGAMYSIAFYEDEAASEAGFAAVSARAREIGHEGQGPDEVSMCEVVGYVENR